MTDDTQASEWERLGVEVAVKHLYLSLGNCMCGWSVAHDGNPPSWKVQWAKHLMAAFREAGLAAVERHSSQEHRLDENGEIDVDCLASILGHVPADDCREMERFSTPWREVRG